MLAFRFFNVFGPLQPAGHAYAAVVPAFVDAALEGRPLPVHGDGTQSRDFTFVDSVCAVLADAVARRVADPEPVNLAFGTRMTLLEVIAELEEMLGHPARREHQPPRAGDVAHSQADTTRLRPLFPDVEPVALAEGLQAPSTGSASRADVRRRVGAPEPRSRAGGPDGSLRSCCRPGRPSYAASTCGGSPGGGPPWGSTSTCPARLVNRGLPSTISTESSPAWMQAVVASALCRPPGYADRVRVGGVIPEVGAGVVGIIGAV